MRIGTNDSVMNMTFNCCMVLWFKSFSGYAFVSQRFQLGCWLQWHAGDKQGTFQRVGAVNPVCADSQMELELLICLWNLQRLALHCAKNSSEAVFLASGMSPHPASLLTADSLVPPLPEVCFPAVLPTGAKAALCCAVCLVCWHCLSHHVSDDSNVICRTVLLPTRCANCYSSMSSSAVLSWTCTRGSCLLLFHRSWLPWD